MTCESPRRSLVRLLHDEIVPARAPWIASVRRGQTLRIVDLEGNQAVDFLIYNAARRRRALQRPGHHRRAGQHLPAHRLGAAVATRARR